MTLFRDVLNKQEQRYRIRIVDSFRCEYNVEAEARAQQHFVVNDMPEGVTRSHQLGKRP